MSLMTENYTANGIQRAFTIGYSSGIIPSESHVRVHFYYNSLDHEVTDGNWDLLGSTILFNVAPISGYVVKITVSSDGEGLSSSPSQNSIVSSNIGSVVTVAENIGSVNTVAGIDTVVTIVADNIVAIQNASNNANIATTKADEASVSASEALTYKNQTVIAKDQAILALDNFDDIYLGQKTLEPTLDNDGDVLVVGALYFDATNNIMKVYNGSQWLSPYANLTGVLVSNNNLSDVSDTAISRTNLDVYSKADVDTNIANVDALPTQTNNADKYLGTDGTNASWKVLDTDANETTKGMYVHENVIDVSYTIPVGSNAVSAGAVTIADLVTITVSDGSSWVVV